jgi:hypothetical protein
MKRFPLQQRNIPAQNLLAEALLFVGAPCTVASCTGARFNRDNTPRHAGTFSTANGKASEPLQL